MLVPAWRKHLEERLSLELLVTSLAIDSKAAGATMLDVQRVLQWLVDIGPIWIATGYDGPEQWGPAVTKAVMQYRRTPIGDWSKTMLERLKPNVIPDHKFLVGVVAGCAHYQQILDRLSSELGLEVDQDSEAV